MKNGKKQLIKMLTGASLFGVVILFCFGNAYGAYGNATHDTTQWQELGTGADSPDYGVFWNTDNGTTWGHEDVYVGDTVYFQFNMHKEEKGTHYADHLKAWLDMDNDKSYDKSDQIIYREELLTNSNACDTFTYDPSKGYTYSFKVTEDFLDNGLFLRARVTCSESLLYDYYTNNSHPRKDSYDWEDQSDWTSRNSNTNDYKNNFYRTTYEDMFAATGNYYQGEVEEWNIGVSKRPDNPVPEPATMILFGCGLLGLARFGRKRKQM